MFVVGNFFCVIDWYFNMINSEVERRVLVKINCDIIYGFFYFWFLCYVDSGMIVWFSKFEFVGISEIVVIIEIRLMFIWIWRIIFNCVRWVYVRIYFYII